MGAEHLGDLLGAILLVRGGVLQIVIEVGVILEHRLHLGVELIQVEPGYRVHQKGPHHGHEGDDEQCHNEHQLHVQGAEHGRDLLSFSDFLN